MLNLYEFLLHVSFSMLNFFKPSCPVDSTTKDWIERRFSWLTDEFGMKRLTTQQTILPTADFLPLEYDCSEAGIERLMRLVSEYMGVDASLLDLNFYEDKSLNTDGSLYSATAGLYTEVDGRFQIWLEVNSLNDAGGVIATLAHEIGHVLLLGQRRVSTEVDDHEELTDLLVVFLGLGIFSANAALHESHLRGLGSSLWSIGKRGYMSMHAIGYALALYALARKENPPTWLNHLRPDAKAYVKRGIRYVTKIRDCQFLPALQAGG